MGIRKLIAGVELELEVPCVDLFRNIETNDGIAWRSSTNRVPEPSARIAPRAANIVNDLAKNAG